MKVCNRCNIERPFNEFNTQKNSKDGYRTICKICRKKYNEENKDKIKEKRKSYYENNKETILDSCKNYRNLNKDKIKEYFDNVDVKEHRKKISKEFTDTITEKLIGLETDENLGEILLQYEILN